MKRITLLHLGIALALTPACGDDGVPVSETEEGTGDTGTSDSTAAPTQSTTISTTDTPPTTGETEDPPTTGDTEDPPTTGDTEDPETTGDTETTTGDDTTGPGEVCGDGEVNGDEECDEGDDNDDTAACKSDCTAQACGDTFIGPDEACDDGNTDSNDGCSSMCLEDGGTTCEAPYFVEALPYSHDGDTTMAGNEYSFDTCPGVGFPSNGNNNEATYSFTPEDDGIYTVTVTSDVDVLLYVATDCADIDATCLGAADGFGGGGTESMFLDGTADTNYFIHTGHYGDNAKEPVGDGEYTLTVDLCIPQDCDEAFCGDDGCGGTCACAEGSICDTSGDAGMCVVQPAGDTCDLPIVVDDMMLPYSDDGDTLNFSNNYGYSANVCPGQSTGYNSGAEDVVYEFTPSVAGPYTITFDTVWDSVIYMVTDCADIDNSCVQAVDGGNPETLNADLEADTTYYIVAGHWSNSTPGSGGAYTFSIDQCVPTACDGTFCGDDGCGGTCACDDGNTCDLDGDTGTCVAEPTEGDTCDEPIVIGALPYTDMNNSLLFANDYGYSTGVCPGDTSSANAGAEDVVYELTPDTTGVYTITLDAAWDGAVYAVTDCADIDNSCVGGAEEELGGTPEVINAALTEGETYYIIGGHWSNTTAGSGGAYTLTVSDVCEPIACDEVTCGDDGCGGTCGCADGAFCIDGTCDADPAGDTCEAPIVIGALPYSGTGTTLAYGNDYGVTSPACPGVSNVNSASEDVVFSYTAAADGDYEFVFDSDWDNTIYVVTDCADIDNTCVGGVDASFTTESITVTMTTGVTYFFIAGPYENFSAGTGGDYTATLTAL